MANVSIKMKLAVIVIVCMLFLGSVITILAVNNSTNSLLESEFNKLSTVQTAKQQEIINYFGYLQALLTSLAQHRCTINAFLAFEEGFYKIEKELQLDVNEVKEALKKDFTENYLDSVNYEVPSSMKRKEIEAYLPDNDNALLAQYIFITNNSEKLGEKQYVL